MLKTFRSHKFYVPLITIIGSAGLFLIYYFFYVGWQCSYADARAFRLLSVVSDQMGKRFENLRNVLAASSLLPFSRSTMDAAHLEWQSSVKDVSTYLTRYLKNVSNIRSKLTGPMEAPTQTLLEKREGTFRLSLLDRPNRFTVQAEYRVGESNSKPGASLTEESKSKHIPSCDEEDSSTLLVCAEISLDTELRERFRNVTGEYFDDILIATSSGEVLFQENLSGLRITNMNALLSAKSPEPKLPASAEIGPSKAGPPAKPANAFQEASEFSNLRSVTLGGAEYKLYIQPMPLVMVDPNGQNLKPIVCGLRRVDRLQSEAVSLPYPALIWGALVLFSAFALIWPLLKVKYMSPSERLRRTQVFYLLFSVLLVTTLLTMIVLNGAYSQRGAVESKEQLEFLANQIDRNVSAELERALHFMDLLGRADFLHTKLRKVTEDNWTKTDFLKTDLYLFSGGLEFVDELNKREVSEALREEFCSRGGRTLTPPIRVDVEQAGSQWRIFDANTNFYIRNEDQTLNVYTDFLARNPDPASDYRYFDNVFFTDHEGQQQYKLTVQREATPRTKVNKETFFKDVRDQRHLVNAFGYQFRFDSLYSPNTGEFLVALAKSYTAPEDWKDLPELVQNLKCQGLVGRFVSLLEPLVPTGFGFAVVDHEGMVQFHSVSSRNQIEDFFKECRQDPALKALVLKAGSDHLTVDYMGKRQEMFVRPMPYLGTPAPALVVFQDTNYFSTINVACLLVFTLLVGMFSLPFLIGLAVCVFRPADYPLSSLWPSADDVPKYMDVMTANFCLATAFAIRFSSMKMDETLANILVMVAVAVFGCVKPKWAMLHKALVLAAILWIAWLNLALVAVPLYIVLSTPAALKRLNRLATQFVKLKHVYLGVVLSLLTVVVVLPAFGFFKISYNTVNRLALQNAQLARRDQLIHRADSITQRDPFVQGRFNDTLDRYDNAVYYPKDSFKDDSPLEEPPIDPDVPDVSYLEKWIASASGFFPSNRLGAELRGTATAGQDVRGKTWKSAEDGDDALLWLKNISLGVAPAQANIAPYLFSVGLEFVDELNRRKASKALREQFRRRGKALTPPIRVEAEQAGSQWRIFDANTNFYIRNEDQTLNVYPAPQNELLGVYPLWQLPWETAICIMLPLAILLAAWLGYLIRKVFLTDLEDVLPPSEIWVPCDGENRNLLIISHPKSGKAARAAEIQDADRLDMAEMVTTGNWRPPFLRCRVTVVNHFEFDMNNPDTCMRKLVVLEKLLYVEKKYVILLSAVDPMFYLTASGPEIVTTSSPDREPPEQVLDRWAAVLSLFQKQQMEEIIEKRFIRIVQNEDPKCPRELSEMVRSECMLTAQLRKIGLNMVDAYWDQEPMSKGQFVEELLGRADSYYRVLWSACSKEERLVLFQLAQDGWVNPHSGRALQQLQRRRIIHKGSGFRIMNESFARFVRSAQSPQEVLKWEEEEEHSVWSAIRLGLGTGLMMLGAWLLYAQQDAFQLGIGYIATLGTASGAVVNLVRNITGSRGGAGSGEAVK